MDSKREVFPLFCKQNEDNILRLHGTELAVSSDGGITWKHLPWNGSFRIRLFVLLRNFQWPPAMDCFGWRNEDVAIAWHSSYEEEVGIGKFVASFNSGEQRWEMVSLGKFDLSDRVFDTWFENVGFEVLTRTRQPIGLHSDK